MRAQDYKMKITKSKLKQIIKEELGSFINEERDVKVDIDTDRATLTFPGFDEKQTETLTDMFNRVYAEIKASRKTN